MQAYRDRSPVGLNHDELALEERESVSRALNRIRPSIVINCAAFHNVDACEAQPERAFLVNAIAVDQLAAACEAVGARLATISTDYVFDGASKHPYDVDDECFPTNVYGISKRAGELLLARRGGHVVFRTSGLYGRPGTTSTTKGYTFVDRVLARAERGEPLRIVTDVISSPSYAPDVADTIKSALDKRAAGVYHVTNSGECSWYDFATAAVRQANLPVTVAAILSTEFASRVRRPLYSALSSASIERLGVSPLPHWRDALARYVESRAERKRSA